MANIKPDDIDMLTNLISKQELRVTQVLLSNFYLFINPNDAAYQNLLIDETCKLFLKKAFLCKHSYF